MKTVRRFSAPLLLLAATVSFSMAQGINYHWTDDPDALAEILDPEWQGALPHTLLIAPGGKIIFRKTGEIDADELRRRIVEHLGRFYVPK